YLEEKGCDCFYFTMANPEHLNLLNKHPFNIFELLPNSNKKQYVFIDEVQYLSKPSNFLKLLYDEKRSKIKLIISGSSAFYIDRKFKDSLAGRKFLFEIYPLNFNEFLVFNRQEELIKKKKNKLTVYYKEKVNALWKTYLTYGGYPKVVLAETDEFKKIIITEIGASYIKKDIFEAGIRNSDKYLSLLKILAEQAGQLVNSQELSNTLGIAHKTIEEYLYIIGKTYQAASIKPFHGNMRKELTKMPKIYFYDLGLRNFLLNDYSFIDKRHDKGRYLENICFIEFLKKAGSASDIKFWRTQDKKEVDFIVGKEAFEVKFNSKDFNKKKYEHFKNAYPEMPLRFIDYDSILKIFYDYR
ncbi:MAG: ATP-binding protein, partial [Elusimicrobiales bacterium]|nr:ATP-binding protein [Elusimicrobiales bacterium]